MNSEAQFLKPWVLLGGDFERSYYLLKIGGLEAGASKNQEVGGGYRFL